MGNRDLTVREQSGRKGVDLGQLRFSAVGVLVMNVRKRSAFENRIASHSFLVGGRSGVGYQRCVTHFFYCLL